MACEADPSVPGQLRISAALPTRKQCDRGSKVIHGAPVQEVSIPPYMGGGTFPYTERITLCGVPSWGVAGGHDASWPRHDLINCGRCKATKAWRELVGRT